jgi:hypothetical protein
MKLVPFAAAALTTAALAFSPAAAQTAPEQITENDIINGTMSIDFATRTNLDTSGDYKDGSPAIGAQDKYKFDLFVAKTLEFTGEITRQPNIYTKTLQRRKQDAKLGFSIDLFVLNPKDLKQKKAVGKWVGTVPIDVATGAYDLAGGRAVESPLRIRVDAIGRAPSFEDTFRGKLIGKAEQKSGLAAYTYKRLVGDKTVEIKVAKVDPMRFENITLAKGPAENYPTTSVTGRLDYDYETANWLTDGIRFKYALDGQEYEDIITGSIKWVEDGDYESTGKGYYDFNLRFNEEKNKTASTEGEAFAAMSDEDAFFAVDNSIPCLTGKISYIDTFGDGETVTASQVTYNLNANKLTKQQVANFFKLWMIGVGPTNDD